MRRNFAIEIVVLAIAGWAAVSIQHAVAGDVDENADVKTVAPAPSVYPSPAEPNYGPAKGSIRFVDTDPGETIGGVLSMGSAVDDDGNRLDDVAAGITMYMVHWGLEVGEPGVADDAGAGDLGGDCMGFRDTGYVVKLSASDAGGMMTWEIPQGTVIPEDAVYFVGHTIYGDIHNLAKCTQTPIHNLVEE